jgi:hypothetical protein
MRQFESALQTTTPGPGYKEALSTYLDWDAYHRFHCLSWILNLSDGPIHASNNLVVVERKDGLFQYLPYSVDISTGAEWSGDVPLYGLNTISNGCQADDACWADTIRACEVAIWELTSIDPVGIVDGVYEQVRDAGMLRPGDEARYQLLRDWYARRTIELPGLLEQYRDRPESCEWPNEWCNGICVPQGECYFGCEPFFDGARAAPGGAADIALPVPCPPMLEPYQMQ